MNPKRLLLILSIFGLTLLVFIYTDSKKEESADVNFWNYDFSEVKYTPPLDGFADKDQYIPNPFILKRYSTGLKSHPFFEVSGVDVNSNIEYKYEGGYPVKNVFIDYSILKTRTLSQEDPSMLPKFSISANSPKIELGNDGVYEKTLLIGERTNDKSSRYVLTENFLISLQNYVIDKFTNKLSSLRHRQLLSIGDDSLIEIKVKGEGNTYQFEDHGKGSWLKFKGKLEPVDTTLFSQLESSVKPISYDLYPDDEIADGFAVATKLTSGVPLWTLEFKTDQNQITTLLIFESINFKGTHYKPVVRKVNQWTESPAYIKEDIFLHILQLTKEIYDQPKSDQTQGK
jgi:hypothetical protein